MGRKGGVEVVLGALELRQGGERITARACSGALLDGDPGSAEGGGGQLVGGAEPLHVGDVGGDGCQGPVEVTARVGEHRLGSADVVEGVARLTESVLGRPGRSDGSRAVVALGEVLLAGGDELAGGGDELACLLDAAADRDEGLGGVGGAQAGELLLGDGQPLLHLAGPGLELAEHLRHAGLEVAHPGELGLLRVEGGVRLGGEREDALEPGALLRLGEVAHPLGVVESSLDPEGLARLGPRGLERLLEALGGLLAELRLGEGQLLAGGADRVVEVDEGGPGPLAEGVDRLRWRASGTGALPTRAVLAAGAGDEQPGAADADEPGHREPPGDAGAADAVAIPEGAAAEVTAQGVAVAGRGLLHGAAPVVVAERRLDVVGTHPLVVLGAQAGLLGGVGAVAAVVHRDSEEHVVAAHAGSLEGLLSPGRAVEPVEGVDVDDEELDPGVAGLLERGVVLSEVPEHAGLVGHLIGDVHRLRRGDGRAQRLGGDPDGQAGREAHGETDRRSGRPAADGDGSTRHSRAPLRRAVPTVGTP